MTSSIDLTGVLRDLLPDGVVVAACQITDNPAPLYRSEAAAVARTVPARRHEFTLGRSLARRALQELGVPAVAVPVGPDRAPVWPPGVVGSVTHGGGYVAVAVGPAARWAGIGIDVEPDLPLEDDASAALSAVELACGRDIVLFSAKEAAFKASSSVARRWLAPRDMTVSLAYDQFVVDAGGERVTGRWTTSAGLVVTVALVDRVTANAPSGSGHELRTVSSPRRRAGPA